MRLAGKPLTLSCLVCGDATVIAVKPGREAEQAVGIILRRGEPDLAWCASCWPGRLRPVDEIVRPIVARARQRRRVP